MVELIRKRMRNETWDYVGENSKISVHGLHPYPAMMLPQIAGRLLDDFGSDANTVLDPFCGSGTVLVESIIRHKNAIGVDINPFAILLSKVKTTPIDIHELYTAYEKISEQIQKAIWNPHVLENVTVPNLFNLDYWFKKKVAIELAYIRELISTIENKGIQNFFLVAFAETVRKCSNTRYGEFKLFRIPKEKLESWNPNALTTMIDITKRNISLMNEFVDTISDIKSDISVQILQEDMRHPTSIPDDFVDIIVTSPPYGDSRTTVAYGQFSRLALQWLGYDYEMIKSIDKMSLGGRRPKNIDSDLPSEVLYETLDKISIKDEKRALDVYAFFKDLNLTFDELDRVLKTNGIVCMVVGNRTVKKINIPTDLIIVDLFEERGYTHLETIVRRIPTKRMPTKGSPSNIAGDKVSTMNNEYIIILQK